MANFIFLSRNLPKGKFDVLQLTIKQVPLHKAERSFQAMLL